MAAKPKRPRIVTVSKEEKAARAGLVKSAQLGLAQNASRVGTQTRGAYGVRSLRQSGTNLSGYDMGSYSDTTARGPALPGGGSGRYVPPRKTVAKPKPKPKPRRKPSINEGKGKGMPASERRRIDARGDYMDKLRKRKAAEKRRREAEARRKGAQNAAKKPAAGTKGGGSKAV